MSRHEWERGEVKMSTKEFTPFRRGMIAFVNTAAEQNLTRAKNIYVALKTAGKGKRNFDFHTEFTKLAQGMREGDADAILDAIFPYEHTEHFTGRSRKPRAPKRNSFQNLKMNATEISVGGEAGIRFDIKNRMVYWHVSENNHAVERAHEHPVGKEFLYRLGKIEWTRGTGGEFVGNDEYNQDSRESGGGANYTTRSFRMLSKKEKAAAAQRYSNSLPSYNPYRGWNSRRGF